MHINYVLKQHEISFHNSIVKKRRNEKIELRFLFNRLYTEKNVHSRFSFGSMKSEKPATAKDSPYNKHLSLRILTLLFI